MKRHNQILENKILTQAELDEIDAKIKVQVQESVDFAEASPFPDRSEAYKDVIDRFLGEEKSMRFVDVQKSSLFKRLFGRG